MGGGTATDTNVYAGGLESVKDSTSASWWTNVYAGGKETVSSNGAALDTSVYGNPGNAGELMLQAGGVAISATIYANGREDVYGQDGFATIYNGGEQAIWNGGSSLATHVEAGGVQFVGVGGVAQNTTIDGNGTERVIGGGTAEGVTFGGTNALLDLDNNSLTGPISGFQASDQIDLRNIQFGAGTQMSFSEDASGTFGMLTVSYGASVDKFTLLGQYMSADFGIASDGHGGTFVTGELPFAGIPVAAPQH
jgi:autotransporter passenger strand-loop-strand repeat protein